LRRLARSSVEVDRAVPVVPGVRSVTTGVAAERRVLRDAHAEALEEPTELDQTGVILLDRPTLGERLSLEAVEDAAVGECLTAGQELLRPGDADVAGRGVGGIDPLGAEHGAELRAEHRLATGDLEEPAGRGVELVDVPARRVDAHHAALSVGLRREWRDLQLLRQV